MTLSGAIGGVGGAVWVLMSQGRWMASVPALGFDGITVSILAGNNPLGVLPAAFLFGILKGGALEIGFRTDVPTELVGVLRGLIILFVAMPEFFRMIGRYAGLAREARAGRRRADRAAQGRPTTRPPREVRPMHNPLADVPIPILDDLIESDYVRSVGGGHHGGARSAGPAGTAVARLDRRDLAGIVFSTSTAASTARLAAPIVLAGLGGIFAEKSGVINIGLEGLLIISAFVSVYVASVVGIGNAVLGVPAIWVGFLAGIAASTALSGVFGIVCIEFKADQIIAGLAVWLIALGLAPFMSTVFFGGASTPRISARASAGTTQRPWS